ncbi:hypothetical protein MASR2M15_01670 [Anaerolineales bacterium]
METAAQIPLLSFRVGAGHYALTIEHVLEVAAMVAIQKVMDTDEAILGVVNRHGQALVLLDLRYILKTAEIEAIDDQSLFIVASDNGAHIGLMVDQVEGVIYSDNLRPAPGDRRLIESIAVVDDELIQVIALKDLMQKYLPTVEGKKA